MGITRTNGRVRSAAPLLQPIGRNRREKFLDAQQDFLDDWRTLDRKVKSVDQMIKNSPLIGGAVRLAIEMSIRKVDWYFTSENGEDDTDLDLVRESWENIVTDWDDHISDAVLAAFYGWTVFTNQYERVNGRLLWKNFKFLAHDTHQEWVYDDLGHIAALKQLTYLWPDPIPAARMLHYRFRHSGNNPEGESILRPVWVPYYYGSNLEEVRAIGYERHAAGMPMVRMPMGADADESGDDYARATKIGRNIRVDEQGAIIIPPPTGEGDHERWIVELMSAGNSQVFTALNDTIATYDKKVMMGTLTQFIIGGMENVGTQAKASVDVGFFTMAVDAFADGIAEQFTKQAVLQLGELNGRDFAAIKLEHSPAGDVDTTTLIEFIKATGGKIHWTAEDEVQIRAIMDMPEKSVEEIEAETERKRAMVPQFPPPLQRPNEPPTNGQPPPANASQPADDDDGEMIATLYATSTGSNPPDQRRRDGLERQWLERMKVFSEGQLKRIKRGLR